MARTMSGVVMAEKGVASTIIDVLADQAARRPADTMCEFSDGRSLSFAAAQERALAVAASLSAAGVSAGDRVGIAVGNRIEFLEVWLGTLIHGAVAVPMNPAAKGPMLRHVLDLTSPSIVFVDDGATEDHHQLVGPRIIRVGEGAFKADYEEFVDAAAAGYVPPSLSPRDVAALHLTSGTTGLTKATVCPHRMIMAMVESTQAIMGYHRDDIVYTCLPLFHVNALITTFASAMAAGARVVIGARFSARSFMDEVRAVGATKTNLLGNMAPILLRTPARETDTDHALELVLAIPLPPPQRVEFEQRFGVRLTELWGSSDVGIPIGVPFSEQRSDDCGAAGKALSGWQCRLVDEFDEDVPVGKLGELVLRPPGPFASTLGYWRASDATVEAWRNFWFHTGDAMRQDEEGWFYFVDRMKDTIRRSGENVSAFEVESVLLGHPLVKEAAVFAVPSDLSEDEIMAAVVPKDGATIDVMELFQHCEALLPRFACPRYIELMDELPKTPTEKVQKHLLRGRGVTENTRDLGARTGSRTVSG